MIGQFEMGNNNGLDMFKRLFEVYGRTPEHTAKIPWLFDWTMSPIEQRWIEYKKCISAESFIEEHPSLVSTAIAYAKVGFQNTDTGLRLLDFLRVKYGERCEIGWSDFVNTVDSFLGDIHKRAFDLAVFSNRISKNVLGFDPNWQSETVMDICEIKNFKNIPNQFPDVKF